MPAQRPRQNPSQVSAAALSIGSGAAPIGPALLADADMGDSASSAAVARLNQAVADLRAITIQPLLQRAVAAIGAGDYQGAADLALKALNRDAQSGFGWYLLAIAREKSGDFKSAIASYESALTLLPNHSDIANDLGRLAHQLGQKEVAAKLFAIYCAANPDCPQGANNMACTLRDLQDYEGAIHVLKPAIMAHPESGPLWNTLGTIISEQGRPAEALVFFEEALRVEPTFAKARYNLGNTRHELDDINGALADCEAAMTAAETPSDLAMMRLAHSNILLCLGRVGEGWDAYEARLDPHFAGATRFLIERPRWRPEDDLAGKSLFLMGEQGLGDEVLFANMIPDILDALGPDGKLSLALEPRLISLFQRSFPTAQIGAHATFKVDGHTLRGAPFLDAETVDLWTPMASPVRRFRRTVEAYPPRARFLVADPERVAYWRGVLEALPGPKIGLLWKSMKLDGARRKYFSPFDQWRAVLDVPGAGFVNLQYGDCSAELAEAKAQLGVEIWQPPGIDLKEDLDDVAALSCAMDLIIGPPNATTNIAAACGAPVWLISTPAAWPRLGTDHYPWYPQVRAFLPDGFQKWDELMGDVARALAAELPRMGA